MRKIFILPIVFYQKLISPLKGRTCMFEPTCSEYTKQAIEEYGPIKGVWLGIKRIARCHPWQKNFGADPLILSKKHNVEQ